MSYERQYLCGLLSTSHHCPDTFIKRGGIRTDSWYSQSKYSWLVSTFPVFFFRFSFWCKETHDKFSCAIYSTAGEKKKNPWKNHRFCINFRGSPALSRLYMCISKWASVSFGRLPHSSHHTPEASGTCLFCWQYPKPEGRVGLTQWGDFCRWLLDSVCAMTC